MGKSKLRIKKSERPTMCKTTIVARRAYCVCTDRCLPLGRKDKIQKDRSQRMKLDYLESTRNQKCILDDSKNVPEKEMNSKEKAFRT